MVGVLDHHTAAVVSGQVRHRDTVVVRVSTITLQEWWTKTGTIAVQGWYAGQITTASSWWWAESFAIARAAMVGMQ